MEKDCVNFLNVTMDICYKTFFYFAKHKDKWIKNKPEKKIAHMELSGENGPGSVWPWVVSVLCCFGPGSFRPNLVGCFGLIFF